RLSYSVWGPSPQRLDRKGRLPGFDRSERSRRGRRRYCGEIDSATPSTLYAVDARWPLFKTIDGGSWKLRGSVVGVSSVVGDPIDSPNICAATQHGILKSSDVGENWAGTDSAPECTSFT